MRKKLRRKYPDLPEDYIRSPFAKIGLDIEEQEKIILKCCNVDRIKYYEYHNKIEEKMNNDN